MRNVRHANPTDEAMLPARYTEGQMLDDGFRVVKYYLYNYNLVVLILLDVSNKVIEEAHYKVYLMPMELSGLNADIRNHHCIDVVEKRRDAFSIVKNEVKKYYDENSEKFLKITTRKAMLEQRKEEHRKEKEWLV